MDFGQFMYVYGNPIQAVVIFVLNVIESVVIIRLWRSRDHRSVYNTKAFLFLFNLSLADILVGFNVILVKLVYFSVLLGVIPNSKSVYVFFHVVKYLFLRLSLLTSVSSLMALTVDRLQAVQNPFQHYQGRINQRSLHMVAITWIVAMVLSVTLYCLAYFDVIDTAKYDFLAFPVIIIPSFLFFIIIYWKIVITVRKHNTARILVCQKQAIIQARREEKVRRLAVAMVMVFFLCWIPNCVVGVLMFYEYEVDTIWINIAFSLSIFNSLLNPLMYFHCRLSHSRRVRARNNTDSMTAGELACSDTRVRQSSCFSMSHSRDNNNAPAKTNETAF